MWEFLSKVLETGGTTAVLFAATFGVFALALRELWRANTRLHMQATDMQVTHERTLKQKDVDCAAQVLRSSEYFAKRIDELQEKRVIESQSITSEVVRHVSATQRSVDKITTSMETLTGMMRRS